MEIRELLRGYKADLANAQIAGNMTVIPLVSEQEFSSKIAEVDEVSLKKDVNYGELQFENQSGRIGIIMQGATLITKQSAQDRTVPRAVIMKGKAVSNVNAFCVQSTQCGLIDSRKLPEEFGDEPPYRILPPILRSNALQISASRGHSFSNLWNALEQYSSTYGMRATSHLRDIYDNYRDSLETFCAQFEPVVHQLGAIVLINGQVIAIDIMPTYSSWKKMWRTLIRDSYGAEAIRLQKKETTNEDVGVVWHYGLDIKEISDLDSLEREMHKAVDQLIVAIRGEWEKVDKEVVTTKFENQVSGINLVNVETDRFVGQAVVHDEHTVYLSMIPRGSQKNMPNRLQSRRQSERYSNEDFRF